MVGLECVERWRSPGTQQKIAIWNLNLYKCAIVEAISAFFWAKKKKTNKKKHSILDGFEQVETPVVRNSV